MDFDLNDEQRAVLEAVEALLERHAGAGRAIELGRHGAYDHALDEALSEAGFLDIARAMSPLEAAMVVEAVSAQAGRVAYGAGALVAPAVCDAWLRGPIALASADEDGPVRYGAQARTLLVVDGSVARVVELPEGAVPSVASNFGCPMGRVAAELKRGGDSLGPGSGRRATDWWRVALAVEAAGAMRSALRVTVEYLKSRRQFGRTIGSFQAVQHRLAECHVLIESARWLAFEAAAHGARSEAAATAAAHALSSAGRVFTEMHQLSGAIGFTHEHDLHVWSMPLHALRLELGGVAAAERRVATSRWREAP